MLRRDLSLQLLALYLLFVGPVVIASVIFDRQATQRLESDVEASDQALARAIALETSAALESALLSVRQLAEYPAVIAADPAGMENIFQILLNTRSDVNLVYRLGADGTMIYHYPAGGPSSTVGQDFSFRDYFERALASSGPLISNGRISPTTMQPVATAVMPLRDAQGVFLGVVGTNLKLQTLSHTLSSIVSDHALSGAFSVIIIDAAGNVIAHPEATQLLADYRLAAPQVAAAVLEGRSGSLIAADPAGRQMLYSYLPIHSIGWGVIIQRSTAEAFATLEATHRSVLALIMVFLVFGLLFWLALSRQVIRPLESLAAFARQVGESPRGMAEHLGAVQGLLRRPDQIGYLSNSLAQMSQAVQARFTELSTLLDTSAVVVSSLERDTVLNRILEQVERLMSAHMCAIIALDERQNLFRVQASRGLSRRYADSVAIDPSEPFSVTLRALHAGEPIQISDTDSDPSYSTFRPRAQAEGYRAIIAMPLKTKHNPPAVLLVYRPEPHVFSENEINLLRNFANHAAMAMENAVLYARSDTRLQEQTRRLEALIQSLQEGLVLEDLSGRVLYANRRVGELLGLADPALGAMPAGEIRQRLVDLALEDERAEEELASLLMGGECNTEISIQAQGARQDIQIQTFDVTDANQLLIGRGLILRDVTRIKELDRMKSGLISTVSHELRTPLASIKGYTTTLLAEDVSWDSQAQREFLQVILAETDRLTELVSDLLDMSRIEAGTLAINRKVCILADLIEQAAGRAQPAPGERLEVELPPDLPAFLADPRRLEAVLRNLIENAAKYSDAPLPIRVSAQLVDGQVIVRVEDRGPGIPAEHSRRIFESFYRVENGLTRRAPGAGVGLAIAQGFVRAHGGTIWVEPQPVGACIAFSIPLDGPETAAPGPA